jgi:hypothetical protein
MNSFLAWRRFAALILSAAFVSAPAFADVTTLTDNARFLAGMDVSAGSPLQPLTKDKAFVQYSAAFNKSWATLDSNQLSKVRNWSKQNLKETQPTLFYMFSGPDFLYANAFFPKATTTVMAGLELPGDVPDVAKLPRSSLPQELSALRGSLNSVFSYSFFITQEMRRRLYGRRLTGTLPVLFVFLARSGADIKSVSYVEIDKDGGAHTSEAPAQAQAKNDSVGVKITFTGADNQLRTLYYFKTDLSDRGTEHSGFLKFCEQLGAGDSLMKSASYLPHSNSFSRVRNFLLKNSVTIVQDDTGIPLRSFDKEWNVEPFGNYVKPISMFLRNYQPDLRSFYVREHPQPIHFSFGYQWRGGLSMLLMATKKQAPEVARSKPLVQPAKLDEAAEK